MSEDTQFWMIIIIMVIGALMIVLWLAIDFKVGTVGIVLLGTGTVTLIKFIRRRKEKEHTE